jgi:signal transduction histidine kinase
MERQLRHMVRLVDELLDVARITQGKLDMRQEAGGARRRDRQRHGNLQRGRE